MDRRALALGILASLSWCTVFVLGRFTIRHHATDPVVLGLYRFGLGGVLLALVVVGTGRGRSLRAFAREPWRFLLLGLTGGFGMGFCVFLALSHTNSITVQIIMNSNPVLIVPLSLLVGERVGVSKVAGVIAGAVGCGVVLVGVPQQVALENPHHVLGGALAALSGLCWAVYTVWGRDVVRRHGGLTTTTLCMLIGGVAFLVACVVMGKDLRLSSPGALTGLYLAVVPTALGFTAWYMALEKLPANVLGPLQFIVPIGGVALAALLLEEQVTPAIVVGGALAL
ncbi:DMT family transporter, partial [bacterium]|nr:DMT family transporter [bacterium]